MEQFQEKDVIRILMKISNQCDFQFLNADRKLRKLTHALKKNKTKTPNNKEINFHPPRRQEKKKQAIASK